MAASEEDLAGKVALVTGASRGIGAAVARRLADAGVALGLGSRSGDDLGIEGGGVATDFAIGTGRSEDMPELDGMMSAGDVADVIMFALTRPRGMRLMTTTFRPMSEASWG